VVVVRRIDQTFILCMSYSEAHVGGLLYFALDFLVQYE